jgi:NAD kinase
VSASYSATAGGPVCHAGATTIECPICHQVYVAIKAPPTVAEALVMHLEIEHDVVVP